MSRAFVKESEGEWLGDVGPELSQLERFLTKENAGVSVYLVNERTEAGSARPIYEMSNGECYTLDEDNRWKMVL